MLYEEKYEEERRRQRRKGRSEEAIKLSAETRKKKEKELYVNIALHYCNFIW